MNKYIDNIQIEGARIGKRNFSGYEEELNAEGNRYFLLYLDVELAKKMEEDGWNVKYSSHDVDKEKPYIKVFVRFGKYPPKIILISDGVQTLLDETNIGVLDKTLMQNVDIAIRPFVWEIGGKSGVKAYVKTMYVTAAPGDFSDKYNDIPMANQQEHDIGIESDKLPF